MAPADTLVCDTAQVAAWQSDPAFAYSRELIAPEINVLEWFSRWFGKLLDKIFGNTLVGEDTIYGVDFAERIADALARTDYREAVRLLYLQTLKQLSDGKRIDWQLYKTPTQYIYEVRLPAFRQMTNHFLRVRYGNFEATETLFHAMRDLQKEVEKGGAA